MHQRVLPAEDVSAGSAGAARPAASRHASLSALLLGSGSGSAGGSSEEDQAEEWEPGAYGLVDVAAPKRRFAKAAAAAAGAGQRQRQQAQQAQAWAGRGSSRSGRAQAVPGVEASRGHSSSGGDSYRQARQAVAGSPRATWRDGLAPISERPSSPTTAQPVEFQFTHLPAGSSGSSPSTPRRQHSRQLRGQLGAAMPQRQDSAGVAGSPPYPLTLDQRMDSARAFGSEFNAPT